MKLFKDGQKRPIHMVTAPSDTLAVMLDMQNWVVPINGRLRSWLQFGIVQDNFTVAEYANYSGKLLFCSAVDLRSSERQKIAFSSDRWCRIK